jgi:hypothetical protein
MPSPYPADDFRKKYCSVWVDIPSELYDPMREHQVHNTYLDQLESPRRLAMTGSASMSTTPMLTD